MNFPPRLTLATYPTPLIAASRLSKTLGINLYFKRDDLISFGLGGNKIRGLEFIVADALANNAKTLITGAGVQSNHVRATAAVAAYCGLDCVAVYWGHEPDQIEGNYRLTKMLGACVHFTQNVERSSVDTGIVQLADSMPNSYAIPRGGACALGVLGHVLAVEELYRQCQSLNISPDTIVLAGGSGGTCAGWLLGIALLNLPWRVRCFSVSRPADELRAQVLRLANEAAALLNVECNIPEMWINDEFIGAGYGIPSHEAAEAIKLVGKTEAVLLDPTYTGKAMAGFLYSSDFKTGVQNKFWTLSKSCLGLHILKNQSVVFIHSGGEPAFFTGDGRWLGCG